MLIAPGQLLRRVKNSRLVSSAVLGGVILVAAGSVGVADAPVTYNACENVATGASRLLSNATLSAPWNACLNASNPSPLAAKLLLAQPRLAEVAISWNQVGPQGNQGIQGIQGAQGMPGVQGIPGIPGVPGTNGRDGAPGKDGAPGLNGTNGTNGTNGKDGKDGASVTTSVLAPGDSHCQNGGSMLTAGDGTITYACNGATGAQGPAGPTGPPGAGSAGATIYETSHAHFDFGGAVMLRPSASTFNSDYTTIASLTVPAGNYEVEASVEITNDNGGCCGDNSRLLKCNVDGDSFFWNFAGGVSQTIPWHKASANAGAATIVVGCMVIGGSGPSNVAAYAWRLTATTVGQINIQ